MSSESLSESSSMPTARVTARRVGVAAAAYTALAGAVTLLGWLLDLPALTDWFNTGISTLPNTAIATLLLAFALFFVLTTRRKPTLVLAAAATFIALVTLFEHISGFNLGLDTFLLLRDWGQTATLAPGRMGIPAATSCSLLGLALIHAALRPDARRSLFAAGLVAIGISLLSLVGYIYGASTLFAAPRLTAIAIPTSTLILALGAGLCALSCDRGLSCFGARGSVGATLTKRLLPLLILLPILVGWIRIQGEHLGMYDSAFGTAVRTIIEVTVLVVVLWVTTRALNAREAALRQAEGKAVSEARRFAAFLESAAVPLHRVGPDGVILWANEAELRMLGYARNEFVGHPIADFHVDRELIEDIHRRLHRGERIHGAHSQMICRDGSLRDVVIDVSALWEDGRFVHTQCFTRDVTAQKQAESAARESERRFHQMIDSLPVAVYTTDGAGRLTYFNPASVELAGRTPELGKDKWCVAWRLYYADGAPMPVEECPMGVAIREGKALRGVEVIAERPDGARIWLQPFPTPLVDAEGRVIGGINMLLDITARKDAELALARLAAIVETSDDAIVSKTLDGFITSWNKGAERLFGYTADEAVGRHISLIIPDDRKGEEELVLARLRRGEKIDHFETIRRTKDGRDMHISLTVSPLRDKTGKVVGASKIGRDITERKRMEAALVAHKEELEQRVEERTRELIEAHERLRLADRMAAVGTMASGLAHDMKNVLAPLGMRLESILTSPGLSRDVTSDLAVICGLLDHLRAMANNLSLFARDPRQDGIEGATSLHRWSEQVRGFMDALAGASVRITWDIPADLPDAGIAPHRLTQAVLNMIHNARDAIVSGSGGHNRVPGTGRIVVRARSTAADHVEISVSDNGCGMSEEVKRRCVEPFFTTKDRAVAAGPGGGTGMGLSLVHAIVERVGGLMAIDSEPGRGTTISLSLPVAAESAAQTGPAGVARLSIRHERRRAIVNLLLGQLKYRIVAGPVAPGAPGETLWITDGDISPESASEFLRLAPDRDVIVLLDEDAPPALVERWRNIGARLVSATAGAAQLRAALAGVSTVEPTGPLQVRVTPHVLHLPAAGA